MVPDCNVRFLGADQECIVSSASIHHGRDDAASQPDASTATLGVIGPLPAGVDIGTAIQVYAQWPPGPPGAGTLYTRFVGTITDLVVEWFDVDQPLATIIAAGPLAAMGRFVIGDSPWPAELDGARAARAITLSGVDSDATLRDPGTVNVLARDVDAQPALVVGSEAAEDGAGMLWERRDGLVGYADALHRRNTPIGIELDACHVPLDAKWGKNLEGLVNDVRIRYGTPPSGGEQPELHVTNQASIDARGRFDASITTRLADQAAAQMRADTILARQAIPAWIFAGVGLPIEFLPASDAGLVDDLLGLEVHSLMSVTGLPAGSPRTSALLWVEGWTETIEAAIGGGVGAWRIDFATSDYCATGAIPRWDDVPSAQTWDTMDPAKTWDGISCLPPTVSRGRWDDVAASAKWDQQGAAITWDTWPG